MLTRRLSLVRAISARAPRPLASAGERSGEREVIAQIGRPGFGPRGLPGCPPGMAADDLDAMTTLSLRLGGPVRSVK